MALNKDDMKNDLVALLVTGVNPPLTQEQINSMTVTLEKIAIATTNQIKRGKARNGTALYDIE